MVNKKTVLKKKGVIMELNLHTQLYTAVKGLMDNANPYSVQFGSKIDALEVKKINIKKRISL
jgi:hypothetical protein